MRGWKFYILMVSPGFLYQRKHKDVKENILLYNGFLYIFSVLYLSNFGIEHTTEFLFTLYDNVDIKCVVTVLLLPNVRLSEYIY